MVLTRSDMSEQENIWTSLKLSKDNKLKQMTNVSVYSDFHNITAHLLYL